MSRLTTDSRLLLGASWYPEMWPRAAWTDDVAKMAELGFNIVRLFEFAWHRLEPEEGKYDLEWARQVMDLCHRHGIAVMVGTPSAAPPAWLTSRYPDVLRVNADGRPAGHGQRKHASHLSPRYRELCRSIVTEMARALSGHPALHSWQIDNEMGGRDFSDEARRQFHAWLQRRYGGIDQLNRAWGLEFWSQAYGDFAQVPMPTASVGSIEIPERHHPSLIFAVARFNSEGWTDYIASQCEAIRKYSDRPITTNMAGNALGSDWFEHNRVLDRVGFSLYADVDHYPWQLMKLERMRGEKPDRPFWLLETAPNWSGGGKQWNIHHNAAGVQAMVWKCLFSGASMALFWQWRSHWAGQEMQHGTCVDATGRWRPNKEAWTLLGRRFAEHGQWLLEHPPMPPRVGLMLDPEAAWALSIDPIDEQMDYNTRLRDDYHLPLVRHHIWRDLVNRQSDLSRYRVLLMPMMPIVPADLRTRLADWVRCGGRLLLGPLTGYRSEQFTAFTDRTFGGLEDLIGAESDLGFSAHWRSEHVRVKFSDGAVSRTRAWCEAYAPVTAQAIAHYDGPGEYGHGRAAAVRHRLGQGTVIALGCMIEPDVYIGLVRTLMSEAGIEPLATGSGDVLVVPRAGPDGTLAGHGIVNLAEAPRAITLPWEGTDAFTGRRLGPAIELAPLEAILLKRQN